MYMGTDARTQISTQDPGVWLLVFVISMHACACISLSWWLEVWGFQHFFHLGIHFKKWSTLISQNNDFIMVCLHALAVL